MSALPAGPDGLTELLKLPPELDDVVPKLDDELVPKLDDVDGDEKLDDDEELLTGSRSSGFNLGIVPSLLPYNYLA